MNLEVNGHTQIVGYQLKTSVLKIIFSMVKCIHAKNEELKIKIVVMSLLVYTNLV